MDNIMEAVERRGATLQEVEHSELFLDSYLDHHTRYITMLWRKTLIPITVCAENMAWKRPVKDIREMCDCCNTTLFNVHWTCTHCGHVICLDCYSSLRHCTHAGNDVSLCKSCKQVLRRCSVRHRQLHKVSDLMPTQIIPSDGRWHVWLIRC